MECGPIAAGLSFNGYDEQTGAAKHNRVQSCVVWKLETSNRVKDFLAAWNISAHMWLKHYIFMRILPTGKTSVSATAKASLITFIVSAIWHGFYPGFYMFFLAAGMMDYQAKLAGQAFSPLVEGKLPGWLVYVLSWIWCYAFCGYFCTAFVLLSFENFHKVYASMYYIGHIILIFAIVVAKALMPTEKKIADEKEKDKKKD